MLTYLNVYGTNKQTNTNKRYNIKLILPYVINHNDHSLPISADRIFMISHFAKKMFPEVLHPNYKGEKKKKKKVGYTCTLIPIRVVMMKMIIIIINIIMIIIIVIVVVAVVVIVELVVIVVVLIVIIIIVVVLGLLKTIDSNGEP